MMRIVEKDVEKIQGLPSVTWQLWRVWYTILEPLACLPEAADNAIVKIDKYFLT